MVTDHFLPFVVAWVPLSWVPPWMSFGLLALVDKLWNCSMLSPSFRDVIVFGVFDSQLAQSARSAPVSPRPAHCADESTNEPSRRRMPPSFPMKTTSPLNGTRAIACWSGCRLTPFESIVMTVKFVPSSSERWIARPFERNGIGSPPKISSYCIAPPM
jgi:hypothetical protein